MNSGNKWGDGAQREQRKGLGGTKTEDRAVTLNNLKQVSQEVGITYHDEVDGGGGPVDQGLHHLALRMGEANG